MHEKNIGFYVSRLLTCSFILLLFLACKPKVQQDESAVSEVEVVELDREFVDFFEMFHEDSLFQLAHIKFPLARSKQDSIQVPWTKENWVMHRPFSDFGGKFKRDFTVMGKLVIENIIDANGFFSMERRFAKLIDGWTLIYYNVEQKNTMSN